MVDTSGDKMECPENKQMQHVARRVKGLMDSQAAALKSAKVATYNRIARWMPYQTPLYFQALLQMFGKNQESPVTPAQLFKPLADFEMIEVPLDRKDSKPESNTNSDGSDQAAQS
jgi:hypothetical protein